MSELRDSAKSYEKSWSRRDVIAAGALGGAALAIGGVFYFKGRNDNEIDVRMGIDVSWPQHSIDQLPNDFPFAVIGVTGGLPTNVNPYLTEQLQWATQATGETELDPIQLYVNTANPGQYLPGERNYTEDIQITTWPKDTIDPHGEVTENPYGMVQDGVNDKAGSWQYGWNRVIEIIDNFTAAANQADIDTDPSMYPWWLDVEIDPNGDTGNTWQQGSSEAYGKNAATLEGMVACFQNLGCRVGLYSTHHMWDAVVGDEVAADSNLNGLDSWLAGGGTQSGAEEACGDPALTGDGRVVMAQYVFNNLDYNVPCAPQTSAR